AGAVPVHFILPAQRGLNGLVQIARGERLGQVAVGPDLEPAHLFLLPRQRRDHDHGDQVRLAIELERFADEEPVHVGQEQIEQNHARLMFANPRDGGFALRENGRLKAPVAQVFREDVTGIVFILDNECFDGHDVPPPASQAPLIVPIDLLRVKRPPAGERFFSGNPECVEVRRLWLPLLEVVMRLLSIAGLWIATPLTAFAGDNVVPALGKFKALVNPNCSHCRDEAKRRAGELKDDEPVLCWIRGYSDGGCIPHRFFLAPYRVISDTYGVFVYDADAGFSRGFAPSLDFDFYGWRNGVMVMKHKDGTLYSCLSGVAFEGPKKGTRLEPVPTLMSDWGTWLALYPHAVAYHMFDKYKPVE